MNTRRLLRVGPLMSIALTLSLLSGCTRYSDLSTAVMAGEKESKPKPALIKPKPALIKIAKKERDWPQFRADPKSTGVAHTKLPEKLSLLWTFTVKEGQFDSTPAIVGDRVYIGDADGTLFALNLKTGKEVWRFKDEGVIGFSASPAVRNGLIYIGDIDGKFMCVNAKTGKLAWSFLTKSVIDSSANFYQDKVLVGSQDATLYCLDGKRGKLIWKHMIDDQIRCSPTVVGDRAFVAGCDGKLHIVDLKTGKSSTKVPIQSPTGVTPTVLGDNTYLGTESGAFFSINWKKASVNWTFVEAGGASNSIRSNAAAYKGFIIFGGRNRRVYALHPDTGKKRWSFVTRRRVDSSPIIVGNRVFVGATDGRLYALNLQSGKKLWQYQTRGSFVGSPAAAHGRLVIASTNGDVLCFGAK